MQAGGDYLDDARASGALGIQARVWQPHRLPSARVHPIISKSLETGQSPKLLRNS